MLGELIRLYRNVHNINVKAMSKTIGVSPATLSRVEGGKEMSAESLMKLMNWLFKKLAFEPIRITGKDAPLSKDNPGYITVAGDRPCEIKRIELTEDLEF